MPTILRLRDLLAMSEDEIAPADVSSSSDVVPETPSSLSLVKGDEDSPPAQPTERNRPVKRRRPRTPRHVQRTPPTPNSNGKLECTWDECDDEIKEFPRLGEWNKHMDKHERPYKCASDGCRNQKGFTYAGGLVRHEREVHGKNVGAEHQIWCPHKSCKRHFRKPFARDQTLREHLRRVHKFTDVEKPGPPSRPRKLDDRADHDDDDEVDGEEEEQVAQTKRRKTAADDGEVERLRKQVKQLQGALAASEKNVVRLEAVEAEFKAFDAFKTLFLAMLNKPQAAEADGTRLEGERGAADKTALDPPLPDSSEISKE
ncbi:hypothetical protein Z517_09411 [Fonsecaea pedrosoi CBS 271.37]|uniref:C2H2-type domain-containing protein n=1 Tax=Fonsecaea pedrosoi CBS 271.37 TaxID=1442368 RepID=A0A0D2ERU4_9EURO|nr:uncharacterized protein Z517_09411 [Fonsecaea pedrosoi CBS 271.37]KIW76967.1 hypothetical protein Z517_09411 [Fonsecaea pedrosoi CBS 271.37]